MGHALGTAADMQGVWWDVWRVWGARTAHGDTHEDAEGRMGGASGGMRDT